MAVDLNGVLVQHAHLCAQLLQNREEQGHIADLGDVLDTAYAIHQQGGRDDSYSGVFRTADGHFTKKLSSAADHVFIQGSFPLFKSSVLVCGGAVPASKAPNIVCPDSARSIRRNTSAISIPYFSIKARKPQEIFKRTEKLHRKKLPGDGYPSPGSLCPLRSALVHCTFSRAVSPPRLRVPLLIPPAVRRTPMPQPPARPNSTIPLCKLFFKDNSRFLANFSRCSTSLRRCVQKSAGNRRGLIIARSGEENVPTVAGASGCVSLRAAGAAKLLLRTKTQTTLSPNKL